MITPWDKTFQPYLNLFCFFMQLFCVFFCFRVSLTFFFFHIFFFFGGLSTYLSANINIVFFAQDFPDIFFFPSFLEFIYILLLVQDFLDNSFFDTVALTLGLYFSLLSLAFFSSFLLKMILFSYSHFYFLIVLFAFSVHFSFKNCTWK